MATPLFYNALVPSYIPNVQEDKKAPISTPSSHSTESKFSVLKKNVAKIFEKKDQKVSRILDSFSERHEELKTLSDDDVRHERAQLHLKDLEKYSLTTTFLKVFGERPSLCLQCQELHWLFQQQAL